MFTTATGEVVECGEDQGVVQGIQGPPEEEQEEAEPEEGEEAPAEKEEHPVPKGTRLPSQRSMKRFVKLVGVASHWDKRIGCRSGCGCAWIPCQRLFLHHCGVPASKGEEHLGACEQLWGCWHA